MFFFIITQPYKTCLGGNLQNNSCFPKMLSMLMQTPRTSWYQSYQEPHALWGSSSFRGSVISAGEQILTGKAKLCIGDSVRSLRVQ